MRQQYERCVGDEVIVQNRTLALGLPFGCSDAHPVVIQVPHCPDKIFGPYLNEFQRPNWLFQVFGLCASLRRR